MIYTLIYQVKIINAAIDNAKPGSRLYRLPHVADPSDDVVNFLIQCMDWNIATRQSSIPEAELPESGISRRRTAFCTRSGRSSCGAIRTTSRVKHPRSVINSVVLRYTPLY